VPLLGEVVLATAGRSAMSRAMQRGSRRGMPGWFVDEAVRQYRDPGTRHAVLALLSSHAGPRRLHGHRRHGHWPGRPADDGHLGCRRPVRPGPSPRYSADSFRERRSSSSRTAATGRSWTTPRRSSMPSSRSCAPTSPARVRGPPVFAPDPTGSSHLGLANAPASKARRSRNSCSGRAPLADRLGIEPSLRAALSRCGEAAPAWLRGFARVGSSEGADRAHRVLAAVAVAVRAPRSSAARPAARTPPPAAEPR
jgi:hypothetical protein